MAYQNFTAPIKRRILEDMKRHFSYIHHHKDIEIRYKYDFAERPQKAIVLMNVSANPIKMSSDNYLAPLESYILKLNVGQKSGTFLEWVVEDTLAVQRNKGVFPAQTGLYYLTIQESVVDTIPNYSVYVDPLYQVKQEPVITFVTGDETLANLAQLTIHPGSLRLYLNNKTSLFSGPTFALRGTQSLQIYDPLFGLPEGPVTVSSSSNVEPFTIVAGVNDVLSFTLNGTPVVVIFLPGLVSAEAAKFAIDLAANAFGLFSPEYRSVVDGGRIRIEASQSLEWDTFAFSPASLAFGFPQGFVNPVSQGLLYRPIVLEDHRTMTLSADGVEYQVIFEPGLYKDPNEILLRLQSQLSGTPVTPILGLGGDFSVDNNTGEITFLQPFLPDDSIIADYLYKGPSSGPFAIEKNHSNNVIIPGVVLAFGESFEDFDKIAVRVYDRRDIVADIYGGKSDVSMDFDIIARDAMDRESITDYLLLYFHHFENERFSEDGLCITSVSGGGESEEVYDETADDYYYKSSVSVAFQTDWEVYVPRPLFIERISPISFEQEARLAARLPMDPTANDYVKPVVSLTTRELQEIARRGLRLKYESIV